MYGGVTELKLTPVGHPADAGVTTQRLPLEADRRKIPLAYPFFPPSRSPSQCLVGLRPANNWGLSLESSVLKLKAEQRERWTGGSRCPEVINKKSNFLSYFRSGKPVILEKDFHNHGYFT